MSFTKLALVAAFSLGMAAPAFAFHCPADIAQIDAALPTSTLSDADKAKVMELRDKGEQLHKAGQHQEAVDTLAQAKAMLGLS